MEAKIETLRKIRQWGWVFIIATAISGITAIPAQVEIEFVLGFSSYLPSFMVHELVEIRDLLTAAGPKLMYAMDWLAYGHLVIAFFFYGVIIDPIKNNWLVEASIIACLAVIPFAFGFGGMRGIPVWWRFIDCSFGLIGLLPLMIIRKKIALLKGSKSFAYQSA